MKLTKTIKIKIGKLSKNKQNILDRLLNKNTKAINFCLDKAKKGEIINHSLVYKDLRKYNLPATVIHGARAKSVEIIKSFYKIKGKSFPVLKNLRVRFDNVIVKLRHTNNKLYPNFISLLYKARKNKNDNRIELPLIINSIYQKEIIKQIGSNFKLGSTELVKNNNNFYVHISYSKEVNLPIPNRDFTPIGIDIGITNLAVSVAPSSVRFHSGQRVKWKNHFFREQRRKLQENFSIKEIKRLRNRQTRYNDFQIHNIAKNIVTQAKEENNPVIVMEDLTWITEKTIRNIRKSQRMKHNDWVWKRLQRAIEYKANWENIPVKYVEGAYTSQICCKCGIKNKRIKNIYKCKSCGFEVNADYNAGRNIAKRFFNTICVEEQASINNAFNSIIPESIKAETDSIVKNNTEGGGFLWQ